MRKSISYCLLLVFLLFFSSTSYSETKHRRSRNKAIRPNIDSLINVVESSKVDSTIIGSLHRLCFAYRAIDLDSAKMYGRQAITYAKESSDKSMEALGYAELAHAFYDSRDFDSALVIYERSNELFGELSMDEDVALNFSNIGRILLKQGKWDEALKSHQKALELLDTASVHVPYINWNIGKTLMTMGKYDEGVEAMKKTISRGDELLAGYARFSIAFSHTLSGDFITAIDHFFKCIEAFKNNKDFEALAQAEFNLGAAYIEIGAFDLGLEYFGKAEEYYRNANHATGLSYVLHGIGVVYAKQNNDEKSLEYLKRSEELKKNGGDHEEIISIKLDIISLLSKQKKAIEVYDIISEIDSSLKLSWDPRSKAKKDLRLGELHFHMGDFNKAKAAYDKALAFQKSEGMQPWAYHTYLNQGVLYDTLGQYEKAIKAFTNAVEIAKQTHSIAEEIEGLQYLYQQYDKTGNVVKSHKYLRRYMMLRDSISSFIKERHIIEMQTKFETTIKEKENEKITAENLVLTKEKKISDYQRIAALSGAAVLSCITLLLFLNFRNKKRVLKSELRNTEYQREQLTREVTRNKKQLDKTTKIISQNGEILEKLEKELEALKSGNHNKEQSISNLETIIHQNLKIGENWDDFAHYFNLVYADFFERLKADYENLTQSELRLCALQVLNLGDKEISKVLYVSPDSIKKARYRLRKKLELPEGKTLKDVLRQYYKSVEV